MRARFRNVLTATALVAVTAGSASATLIDWQNQVASGTANVFIDTNVTLPTTRNIGSLTGDKTYELIVNGSNAGVSSTLIGVRGAAPDQAIKFEQYNNTGRYGATLFGIVDLLYGTPTTFNQDVHLAFTVDSSANGGNGNLSLYVNGIFAEALNTPQLIALQGNVGVGSTWPTVSDPLTGTMHGIATYDSIMPDAEILAHANAYFSTIIPEPSTFLVWSLLAALGIGWGWRRRKR